MDNDGERVFVAYGVVVVVKAVEVVAVAVELLVVGGRD